MDPPPFTFGGLDERIAKLVYPTIWRASKYISNFTIARWLVAVGTALVAAVLATAGGWLGIILSVMALATLPAQLYILSRFEHQMRDLGAQDIIPIEALIQARLISRSRVSDAVYAIFALVLGLTGPPSLWILGLSLSFVLVAIAGFAATCVRPKQPLKIREKIQAKAAAVRLRPLPVPNR